jgi:hypothetical protein
MQRFKLLGLTVLAVFVLGAVASSSAFGALPTVLPETAKISGTTGKGTLETTEGLAITCEKSTVSETAFKTKGAFHITFTGCTGPAKEKCESLGDAAGIILVLGEYHFVFITLSPLVVGLALLLSPEVHIDCLTIIGEVLLLVKGCIVGSVSPINTSTTAFTGVIEQTKGDNKFQSFENDTGEAVPCFLLTKKGAGAFILSGDESAENKFTSTAAVEIMG